MKNIFILIAIFSILPITGCDKEESLVGVNVDIGALIAFKSIDGIDLLNPENPNYFKEEGIKIFYEEDGKLVEFYDGSDNPRGFNIEKINSEYRLGIFAMSWDAGIQTNYLKLSESIMDTIKYEIEVLNNGNTVQITKMWYNDAAVWDRLTDDDYREFEIIK